MWVALSSYNGKTLIRENITKYQEVFWFLLDGYVDDMNAACFDTRFVCVAGGD